jgi:hypothetical protein
MEKFNVKITWNSKELLSEEQRQIVRDKFLAIRYQGEPWNKGLDITDGRVFSYMAKRKNTVAKRGYLFDDDAKKRIGSGNRKPKPSVGIALKKYYSEHGLTDLQIEALRKGRESDREGHGAYPKDFDSGRKWLVKTRDDWTCQLCKKDNCILSIHHIDYNKSNCLPGNLISLCNSCHGKTITNREYWSKYFRNYIYENIFKMQLQLVYSD